MGLRNADANLEMFLGVPIEMLLIITLFWMICVILIFGIYNFNYGIAGPITVLVVLGNCLFIKSFGWQALAIPAGMVILFYGFLMLCRR